MPNMTQLNSSVISFLSTPKKFLIGGKWVDSVTGDIIKVYSPSTGEMICTVPKANKEDVDLAVKAARQAFEEGPWPVMKPRERARLIWKLVGLLEQHAEEFAQLDSLNMGVPISITPNFLNVSLAQLEYYAGWTTKITGETIPVSNPGNFMTYTIREPLGVIASTTAWNAGVLAGIKKVAPALATGNTIVLRPSRTAPLSAIRFGELVQEAGFPDGVLNIITGNADAGRAMTNHPDVDLVTFTGSTRVGKEIIEASAGTVKRLLLELGGKSANIIFADANYDQAIKNASAAIFTQSGQVCYSGSRLFVERSIYDRFLYDLAEYTKTIRIGDSFDRDAVFGPLISAKHRDEVLGYVREAEQEGAKVLIGGESFKVENSNGCFIKPTIVTNVTNDMKICQEEIFGPVVVAMPFDGEKEAIQLANDSKFGLGGGICTTDLGKAHRVARAFRTGMIWINSYGLSDPHVPFGGYKQSGVGRELGNASIDCYTQTKCVWVNLS